MADKNHQHIHVTELCIIDQCSRYKNIHQKIKLSQ